MEDKIQWQTTWTYLLLDWAIKDCRGIFLCEGGDQRKLVRRDEFRNGRCSELAICIMSNLTVKPCVEMERKGCCWKVKQVRDEGTVNGQLLLLFLQQDYGRALGFGVDVEQLSHIRAGRLVEVDVFQP